MPLRLPLRSLALLSLALPPLALSTAADASVCSLRAAVLESLARRYGEAPVAAGLTLDGQLFEVLAAPDGKTWTVIQTAPSGLSCLVAAGESWQRREAPSRPAPAARSERDL